MIEKKTEKVQKPLGELQETTPQELCNRGHWSTYQPNSGRQSFAIQGQHDATTHPAISLCECLEVAPLIQIEPLLLGTGPNFLAFSPSD